MTVSEVFAEVSRRGLELIPEGEGLRVRGRLDDDLRQALRQHKPRVVALLRLRELHRGMGLSEEDVRLVELAFLDDRITEVRIIIPGPPGVAA